MDNDPLYGILMATAWTFVGSLVLAAVLFLLGAI